MNVGELKKMLTKYPDDMEVIHTRCSDFEVVDESMWSVVKGVFNPGGWVMRSHPTMSQENKSKEKAYLHLVGN